MTGSTGDGKDGDPLRVVGHADAESLVLQLWQSARLAGGVLLDGPQGIGKATLARRFARFLLASDTNAAPSLEPNLLGPESSPTGLDVDPDTGLARRVLAGSHSDLLIVARSTDARQDADLPVAEVRRVPDFLHQTPGEGGWRIVIVDDADSMNSSAANALLKVLEEPPSRSLVLLVAHAPGKLPATIRSRCRRLALRPIPHEALVDWLASVRPELASEQRTHIAALAEGRPGRALTLIDRDGLSLCGDLETALAALPSPDWHHIHALGDRLSQRKNADGAYALFVELLFQWLGAVIRRAGAGGAGTTANLDTVFAESLARHAVPSRLESWLTVWDKTAALIAAADRQYLDRKQVVLRCFGYLAGASAQRG